MVYAEANRPGPPAAPQLQLLNGLWVGAVQPRGEGSSCEGRHHVQAVLALAGASRKGMARDELVDVLWLQSSTTAGRNRLYHTVHMARQALSAVSWDDEWLVVRNARVLLDERVWCDVQQLERAGERSAETLGDSELHTLVPLCQGDWMPQLDVGAAGEAVRARVRTAQGELLREVIVRSQRQGGDTPALRELLHSLLRIQATDEWAHRELMRLDLAAGRRHAVLRTFDKLSQGLGEKLGLRPSAQTVAVAAAAAAELQETGAAAAPEGTSRATPLVGREALIKSLVEQLGASAGLWNLTGLSGIGKTTLARAVAHRLAPAMEDGVCVVNFGDLGAYESAASACVRTLGLASGAEGDEIGQLVQAVQLRQMLLVLDDIDAAADGHDLLQRLPLDSMRTRFVVTSRAPVKVVGAQVVPVVMLPVPAPDATPEQAGQSAAYALFQMRCPLASLELQTEAWRSEAVQLVRQLEGLPLAIELAAARTDSMTPGEIQRQIERTLRALGDGPVDLQGRHRSLQASLDWSVKLLSSTARSGYGALAVFPGGFLAADVAGLMPAVGLARSAAEAVLEELAAAGLLAHMPDTPQLRMLHLPRAHARTQAEARGQWPAVVTARLVDVCAVLDAHPLDYESSHYARHLRRVVEIEDDAVSLLDHACKHDPQRFVRMMLPLCESWGVRGSMPVMMRWAPSAIAAAQNAGLKWQELSLRSTLTQALRVRDNPVVAEQYSQAMLPLMDEVTEHVTLARAATARARALRAVGQVSRAASFLRDQFEKLALDSNAPGYWTLRMAMADLGCPPAGVEIDLTRLRQRHGGSRLWLEILRVAYISDPGAGQSPSLLALTRELVACAEPMRAYAAWISGATAQAYCQLAQGDTAGALQSYQATYRLAAETGWTNAMAAARLDAASVQLHLQDTNAAALCIDQARGLPAAGPYVGVRMPMLRTLCLALQGDLEAAKRELLSMPSDALQDPDDDCLFEWAEAGALLAMRLGEQEFADKIVTGLRGLECDNDVIPVSRRFRDEVFGPDLTAKTGPRPSAEEVRRELRYALHALHQRLQ